MGRCDLFNLLNNDKQIAWDTVIDPDGDGPVDGLGLPTRYIDGRTFGQATSNSHFPTARTLRISLGIRF